MKRITFLLAQLMLLFATSACSPQQDSILRIGSNQWPGYETLYLARDLGYFDQKNIKLIELTSATETMSAFKHNQIDVAALTLDEVLLLSETEVDLRVFLVMDISNGADKLMVAKNISSLEQLKGKRIALENSALGAFMLLHLLEHANLTADDVIIRPSTIDQHVNIMTSGKTDAVITFDPMATTLADYGFNSLFDSSMIPGKIVDVLVTRQSVIEQHPNKLKSILDAQWFALNYIKQSPDDAYQRIAPRLALSKTAVAESYRGLILPDHLQNQQLLAETLHDTIQRLGATMLAAKLVSATPKTDQLLDPSLVMQP